MRRTITHRITRGTAVTWCGRALEGVASREGSALTYAKRAPGTLLSITTGEGYDCKSCKRSARGKDVAVQRGEPLAAAVGA